MLANRFSMRASRLLLACLSVAACLAGIVCIDSFFKSASASTDGPILVDMPIYSRTSSDDLIRGAESMVSQTINRHFDINPGLAEIEVVVLGNRNGDVIPVLTTAVSRTQWQENPQVSAWSKYYSAYALIRRHDRQPTQVATVASRRSTSYTPSQAVAVQFERQFDSGQLTGRTIQAYTDLVD